MSEFGRKREREGATNGEHHDASSTRRRDARDRDRAPTAWRATAVSAQLCATSGQQGVYMGC